MWEKEAEVILKSGAVFSIILKKKLKHNPCHAEKERHIKLPFGENTRYRPESSKNAKIPLTASLVSEPTPPNMGW